MAYPQYYYPQQNFMSQPQQIMQQNNGFISVRNEAEARNYPVAFGNSVTFKDENAPYVYTKTMGFSQLDSPRFEKFKLVKEETVDAQTGVSNVTDDKDTYKGEIDALWGEIDVLKREVFKQPVTKKKKEVSENDPE